YGDLFGAGDNEILLWLQGGSEDSTRTIVFKNTETGKEITVVIEFKAVSGVEYITENAITEISDETVSYDSENDRFIIPDGVTEFTFKDGAVDKVAVKDEEESVKLCCCSAGLLVCFVCGGCLYKRVFKYDRVRYRAFQCQLESQCGCNGCRQSCFRPGSVGE
ncbi:MAG: hypothetical protein WC334_10480, partial [Kiritimatiellales bacterium]